MTAHTIVVCANHFFCKSLFCTAASSCFCRRRRGVRHAGSVTRDTISVASLSECARECRRLRGSEGQARAVARTSKGLCSSFSFRFNRSTQEGEIQLKRVKNKSPNCGDHFSCTIYLELLPGTVLCSTILQMGGWILKNVWIIKPSSMA